jgi:hypothetical protein
MLDPKQLIEKHTNTIYIENQGGLESQMLKFIAKDQSSSIGSFVKKPLFSQLLQTLSGKFERKIKKPQMTAI